MGNKILIIAISKKGFKNMSGMITTADTSVSSYGNRTIAIEVTGVSRQDIMRTSNYTLKVPYSRMSQTIKSITRMGGKVAGVSLGDGVEAASAPKVEAQEPQEQPRKRSDSRKNRSRK